MMQCLMNAEIPKTMLAMSLVVLLAGESDATTRLPGSNRRGGNVANFLCEELKQTEKIPLSDAWSGCKWDDATMSSVSSQDGTGDKKVFRAIVAELAEKKDEIVFYFEYAFQCGSKPKAIAVHYYPDGHCDKGKYEGGFLWQTGAKSTTWGSHTFDIKFNVQLQTYWPIIFAH